MVDTARIQVPEVDIDISRLQQRGWRKNISSLTDTEGRFRESISLTKTNPGNVPHFMAYYASSGLVVAEANLPRIVHGDNVSMLSPEDLTLALDELSDRMANQIRGALPHIQEWEIAGRLDWIYQWQVGHLVGDYLSALSRVYIPRHRTECINGATTVYWKNGVRWLRAYDKAAESKRDMAKGLLRFEVEMKRPKSEIKKLASTSSSKVKDVLNWKTAKPVLEHYLGELKADLFITDEERVISILLDKCDRKQATRLVGFLSLTRLFSRQELLNKGFKRNWLWRNGRDVMNVGLSAGAANSGLLPPLLLPKDYDGSPGRVEWAYRSQ